MVSPGNGCIGDLANASWENTVAVAGDEIIDCHSGRAGKWGEQEKDHGDDSATPERGDGRGGECDGGTENEPEGRQVEQHAAHGVESAEHFAGRGDELEAGGGLLVRDAVGVAAAGLIGDPGEDAFEVEARDLFATPIAESAIAIVDDFEFSLRPGEKGEHRGLHAEEEHGEGLAGEEEESGLEENADAHSVETRALDGEECRGAEFHHDGAPAHQLAEH